MGIDIRAAAAISRGGDVQYRLVSGIEGRRARGGGGRDGNRLYYRLAMGPVQTIRAGSPMTERTLTVSDAMASRIGPGGDIVHSQRERWMRVLDGSPPAEGCVPVGCRPNLRLPRFLGRTKSGDSQPHFLESLSICRRIRGRWFRRIMCSSWNRSMIDTTSVAVDTVRSSKLTETQGLTFRTPC